MLLISWAIWEFCHSLGREKSNCIFRSCTLLSFLSVIRCLFKKQPYMGLFTVLPSCWWILRPKAFLEVYDVYIIVHDSNLGLVWRILGENLTISFRLVSVYPRFWIWPRFLVHGTEGQAAGWANDNSPDPLTWSPHHVHFSSSWQV
jgi:hypothetical protein